MLRKGPAELRREDRWDTTKVTQGLHESRDLGVDVVRALMEESEEQERVAVRHEEARRTSGVEDEYLAPKVVGDPVLQEEDRGVVFPSAGEQEPA